MRRFLVLLILGSFLVVAGTAGATTLSFTEFPNNTQLEGTNLGDPFGVSFMDAFTFGFDNRLPDDGFGITNSPGNIMEVAFIGGHSDINTFTWATASSGSFFGRAYNSGGGLVDTFTFINGTGVSQSGVGSLTGAGIVRMEFNDSSSTVALDTLTYDVIPEPASLLLLGLGVGVMGLRRRIRR